MRIPGDAIDHNNSHLQTWMRW